MFMCGAHWMKVPKHLRDLVWRFYRPGQEIDKRPTQRYLEVAAQAINAVALHETLTVANRVFGRSKAQSWLHRSDNTGKTPYENLQNDYGFEELMKQLHELEHAELVKVI